jgi:hypothetical protein
MITTVLMMGLAYRAVLLDAKPLKGMETSTKEDPALQHALHP